MGVSPAVLGFVQRCQVALAAWLADDWAARLAAVWDVVGAVPPLTTAADRGAVAAAVMRVATRVVGAEPPGPEDSAGVVVGAGRRPRRAVVNAAVAALARRYPDRDLILRTLAAEMEVSYWSLSRALRAETGYGFCVHLHGFRVLSAAVLLRTTLWAVKEVAFEVGYWPTSELDAQFGRWLRMTPGAFRAAMAPWRLGASDEVLREDVMAYVRRRPTARPAEVADTLRLDLGVVLRLWPATPGGR